MPVLGDRIVECCCGGRTRVYHITDIGAPYNCSSTNSTLQRSGQLPSGRHGYGVPGNGKDGSWQRVRFSDDAPEVSRRPPEVSRTGIANVADDDDIPPELPEKTRKRKSDIGVRPTFESRDAKRSDRAETRRAGDGSDVTTSRGGSLPIGAATCGTGSATTGDVIMTSDARIGETSAVKQSMRRTTSFGAPVTGYDGDTYAPSNQLHTTSAISRGQRSQPPDVTTSRTETYDNATTRTTTEQHQQHTYYSESSQSIQRHLQESRVDSATLASQSPTPSHLVGDVSVRSDGAPYRQYAGYVPPDGRDVMGRFRYRVSQYDNSPPDVSPRSDSTMYSSRQSSERYFLSDVSTPRMMTSHSDYSPGHSPGSLLADAGGSPYGQDSATQDSVDGHRQVSPRGDLDSSDYTWQDIVEYYDAIIDGEQHVTTDRGSPYRRPPTPDSDVYIVGRVYFDGGVSTT